LYTILGGFFQILYRQKPARLALLKTRPTLFEKIPGGDFERNTNMKATQTCKLQPKNRQYRACRIELADLGKESSLQIWADFPLE